MQQKRNKAPLYLNKNIDEKIQKIQQDLDELDSR